MKKIFYKAVLTAILICITLCSCTSYMFETKNIPDNHIGSDCLAVHYLDVGQGDSIFVEMPNDRTMLIDAGEDRLGKSIISYINSLGYDKIDYLVATHPHADHIGSMAYIVRHMDIGEVYMPKVSTNTKTFENLLESVSDKGLNVNSARSGINIIDTQNFDVDILAPDKIDKNELNNCSIVLKITFGDTVFLFTGDAEMKELDAINDDISADVLKVGHHGSDTSTNREFLARVNPEIAVISLGKDNDYGHPHKSTLKYLGEAVSQIYRTDKDGTVIVTSDGESISVETDVTSMEKDE